jgi:glycine cleavage system aminomethyltransferase T
LSRRLVQFRLKTPSRCCFTTRRFVRDGKIVGTITSGNYGHHLGGAIGLGYVPSRGESAEQVLASDYEIEIAGVRVKAEASLRPMYDPKSERTKL